MVKFVFVVLAILRCLFKHFVYVVGAEEASLLTGLLSLVIFKTGLITKYCCRAGFFCYGTIKVLVFAVTFSAHFVYIVSNNIKNYKISVFMHEWP